MNSFPFLFTFHLLLFWLNSFSSNVFWIDSNLFLTSENIQSEWQNIIFEKCEVFSFKADVRGISSIIFSFRWTFHINFNFADQFLLHSSSTFWFSSILIAIIIPPPLPLQLYLWLYFYLLVLWDWSPISLKEREYPNGRLTAWAFNITSSTSWKIDI